jgi:hypothetical protein
MVGWEKYFFLINLTKVTYNGENGHYSSNLVLGSSSTVHQPLPHMLLLFSSHKMVAKYWGKGNTKIDRLSFLFFSLFLLGPLTLLL